MDMVVQPRSSMILHFRNLSRGFLCGCSIPASRVIRLQSTACEQKRWGPIIHEVGADLLFSMAMGHECVIHDRSEKDRETRACWQGLSWLRYATNRAWSEKEPPQEFSRGGMVLNPYWEGEFRGLDRPTRRLLRYYGKYYTGGAIKLESCYEGADDISADDGPSE